MAREEGGDRMKRLFLAGIVAVLLQPGPAAWAQDPVDPVAPRRQTSLDRFSLTAVPGLGLPLGESSTYYAAGGGMDISFAFAPLLPLTLRTTLGYGYTPLVSQQGLSRLSATAGVGLSFPIASRFVLSAYGEAGYGLGMLHEESTTSYGGSMAVLGGAEFGFLLTPSLELGVAARARSILGLYTGTDISLAASYRFGGQPLQLTPGRRVPLPPRPEPIKSAEAGQSPFLLVGQPAFDTVFPVLFKFYEAHPLGRMTVENPGPARAENVRVTLFVHTYMDVPRECVELFTLEPGEKREVELKALFNGRVLEVTEATMVTAEVGVEYRAGTATHADKRPFTLRMWDRNAVTWDDDRKVAAFVTAKDPAILALSRTVSGVATEHGSNSVSENLRKGMGMYYAVVQSGVRYVVDPRTPYAQLSALKTDVDFLQFPRQTLEYRGGDCDDLSILYCALLESVGVDTGFITVPGHIMAAFSLGRRTPEMRAQSQRGANLVFDNDEAWVPVEITELKEGFLRAWEAGAKQWREQSTRGQATLHRTREAWKTYEPVGLPATATQPAALDPGKLAAAFLAEMARYVDREISDEVAKLQAEVRKAPADPRPVNRLGILYASYGLTDRAVAEFERILKRQEYLPALLNLGNIRFLAGDYERALQLYERAAKKDPESPHVLLALARVSHELENYGVVRSAFNKLKTRDPGLAAQYAYLDLRGEEATRAASVSGMRDTVVWEE
jgi:transglutaminase-like putative cysteine protease